MHLSRMKKDALWSRLFRSAFIALAAIGILLATASAHADCGDPMGFKSGVAHKLPFLAHSNSDSGLNPNHSIVGLWHVTYTSGGALFYEAFDMWHADGTEFENANVAPATGNICLGVWRQSDDGTVRLNHIGWMFDALGNSTGTFTLTETNQVGPKGETYTGEFDYKAYDVDGNLVFETTGTQTATRISAN